MVCPVCERRLRVPAPIHEKPVAGKAVAGSFTSLPTSLSAKVIGQFRVDCPGCKFPLLVSQDGLGQVFNCPKCEMVFSTRQHSPAAQLSTPFSSSPSLPSQPLADPSISKKSGVKDETEGASISCRKRSDEKFCVECGSIIRARAEICPSCGVRQLADARPLAVSKPSFLATALAWCCPAALAIAYVLTFAYTVAYASMPIELRFMVRANTAQMPPIVAFLGFLMFGSMALGLGVTVVTFVLGIMKNHKLAIVLSSVTFVLAWPLLFCASFWV